MEPLTFTAFAFITAAVTGAAPWIVVHRVQLKYVRQNYKICKEFRKNSLPGGNSSTVQKVIETTVAKELTSTPVDISLNENVKTSLLTGNLKDEYLGLSRTLMETLQLNALTVEHKHDLGAIKENLLSSIRLFNSLPKEQRSDRSVDEQMRFQLKKSNKVIESIKTDCQQDILRELKMNSTFLETRYPDNELTV